MISGSMSTKYISLVGQKTETKQELHITTKKKYSCSISETKKLITEKRKKIQT